MDWNIYYPSLGQWLSFGAGLVLVIGNLSWVILALELKYAKKRCEARMGIDQTK